MTYTTSDDQGRRYQAATIEGALAQAVMMIYAHGKALAEARADLADGKVARLVYGFKTVTIEPGVAA